MHLLILYWTTCFASKTAYNENDELISSIIFLIPGHLNTTVMNSRPYKRTLQPRYQLQLVRNSKLKILLHIEMHEN